MVAVVHQAALVELLLDRCLDAQPFPAPPADPAAAVDALLTVAATALANRTEPGSPVSRSQIATSPVKTPSSTHR